MKDTHFIPGPAIADTVRPGLGLVCLISLGVLAVAVPLTWIGVIAVAVAASLAFGALVGYLDRAPAHAILPAAVAAPDLREAYRAVLAALANLDRTVTEAPRLRGSMAPVLERCRAAVATCGRMAQLGAHHRIQARLELTRAALESFTATIAKRHDPDGEVVAPAVDPAVWPLFFHGSTVPPTPGETSSGARSER